IVLLPSPCLCASVVNSSSGLTMLRRTLAALLLVAAGASAQDVNDATEKAMKAAAAKVAPSVARIETSGGAEAIWGSGRKGPEVMFRRGVGASPRPVVAP